MSIILFNPIMWVGYGFGTLFTIHYIKEAAWRCSKPIKLHDQSDVRLWRRYTLRDCVRAGSFTAIWMLLSGLLIVEIAKEIKP